MAKKAASRSQSSPLLFIDSGKKRHPNLFLPNLLKTEADKCLFGPDFDKAFIELNKWADLAEQGYLNQKETALDAEFLQKVFGDALGYRSVTENPTDYHRQKQFTVPGAGTADGALGRFTSGQIVAPIVIIELKGARTDLDHDKFNGRTPVQQCWDYLNQLPDTPWGIVSNYVTIRLYHRDMPARAYEEFTVADFRDKERFRQFYTIFERIGLIGDKVQVPRAQTLLRRTATRQKQVGDVLYEDYSDQRLKLIEHLIAEHHKTQDEAIHIAQKIIDRIVFVAFCEDRALLPEKLIHKAYNQLPAFSKVTNPRWQNFKALFGLIDKGDEANDIPEFNGGLFRTDASVDNLELDDKWTHFFLRVDRYDFKDEINVEVLGNLFEKSITELEKMRVVGLFGKMAGGDGPIMPKSAMRKRFGVYYTPPQFTQLIVDNTLGEIIRQRVDPLPDLREKVAALRKLRVVDPACGSGAFLIAAYERFEDAYETIARQMRIDGLMKEAQTLTAAYPDFILSENVYGVDLYAEAVEITQLALWIRSARKGRTLADLSKNIICGNSLVRDPTVHLRAMDWASSFPAVFSGEQPGFDVVIGNPPWERLKLQEREFFALARPDIASAVSAADRKKFIAAVEAKDPQLWHRYLNAKTEADRVLGYVRDCGDYPFTGRGDINTYMLFAELATKLVNKTGRLGLLVPSGIATDDTTRHFFAHLMASQRLIAIYDFENRLGIFPDVDGRFKFCILLAGGGGRHEKADFVFFARNIEDLKERDRHIDLTAKDLALFNPNTRTCPIFRSRRDADLTRRVYRRVPILIDENRKEGGNPWSVQFVRMFDQTNDAELFKTARELSTGGFKLDGNRWVKRKETYLPLYEAKMIQSFDHRAAGVRVEAGNWMRQGQTEETSLVEHQNPEFVTLPRFWIAEERIDRFAKTAPALLAYKDVTSATNQRTMIAALVPRVGLMNSAPFIHVGETISPRHLCCLLANLNSLAYDFIARQKVGGLHLNFFIVEQLPTLPPDRYDDPCPWDAKTKLVHWVSERVLKLTCTANDMLPLALATRFKAGVHPWKPEERDQLRAELDAAFFHLYSYSEQDVEYVLDTFQSIRNENEAHAGNGATRKSILSAFNLLQTVR